MANPKTTYQALVGLDFDGLKPPVRVEQGGEIPSKVSASELKELLEQGFIRQVTIGGESEGDE